MDRPPPEQLPAASYLQTHDHLQHSIAAVVRYLKLGWRLDTIARGTLVALSAISHEIVLLLEKLVYPTSWLAKSANR